MWKGTPGLDSLMRAFDPGRSNKDSEETSASPESSDVFPIYLPRTTTYMGGGKDSFQKPIDPLGMQCFRLRASP
jgi:hypothetical protein